MLASTQGVEFNEDASWDEKEEVYRLSGKIVRTTNCTQTAVGTPQGLYTTVVAAAFCCFERPSACLSLARKELLYSAVKNEIVEVQVKGVLPTTNGCAVFVGNDEKTFVIYVDHSVGAAITMFLRNTPKERPLTHDLIGHIFTGLGISVERVIINDLKNSTYFARLILRAENELGKKILEIDARPSDCIALAVLQKSPIYVANKVFSAVEDMSEVLKRMNEEGGEGFAGQEEEQE